MTIDINLCRADEAFLADIEEIMEDTMVQMFILHPKTTSEIEEAQEFADEHESIFYSVPLSLQDNAGSKCVAFSITGKADAILLPNEKPIIIDAALLDDEMIAKLSGSRGIILNPTQEYTVLEGFYLAMGIGNVGAFGTEVLAQMSMDKIVLQSSYPNHGFEEIMGCVKVISNAMFRPEQSIIARATKSSLELFGFRKS